MWKRKINVRLNANDVIMIDLKMFPMVPILHYYSDLSVVFIILATVIYIRKVSCENNKYKEFMNETDCH